jgi:hypothetical protein
MRGSPIVRLLIMIIAMGLVLIPLIRLTDSHAPESVPLPPAPADPQSEREIVDLEITVLGGPVTLEVTHLGEIVWQGRVNRTAKRSVAIHFPNEGIELGIVGEFEGRDSLGALRISVSVAGGKPIERTVWSKGLIDEVLLFERR